MISRQYNAIESYLRTGNLPTSFSSTQSNFIRETRQYQLRPDGLYRGGKKVVKYGERKLIFDEFHRSHSGRDITWKKINERYYWRGIYLLQ